MIPSFSGLTLKIDCVIETKPLRDAEAELTATRGSRLSQVLQSSKPFRDNDHVKHLLDILMDANARILSSPGIEKSLENISRQLRDLHFDSYTVNPAIEIAGGTEIAKLSEPEKRQIFRAILEKLQLLMDSEDRNQGLGYNNLLFMATELLLLDQEDEYRPILLVEEPEAHLHPQLQMKVLGAIKGNIGGAENLPLQSILTTHSPNLASKAPLENIIMMAQGKAFPLRATETELEKSDYVFLEKFLDVTKSNLFFAKAVLIVEGDAENILLPTIAELLGKPLESFGVSVVNVGNTAFVHYAKIFQRKYSGVNVSRTAWLPTKVVCLLDLDLMPDRAEKRDDGDLIGFVTRRPVNADTGHRGNHDRWLSSYDKDTLLAYKTNRKKKIEGQNVTVELSDDWTFEYSLALNGLAFEIHESIKRPDERFEDLPTNAEEKAISLFRRIALRGEKTKLAYRLALLLKERYKVEAPLPKLGESSEETLLRRDANASTRKEKQDQLRSKLPRYIVRAIDLVTSVEEIPEIVSDSIKHFDGAARA